MQRLLGQAYLGVGACRGPGLVCASKGIQGRLVVSLAHSLQSLRDERVGIVAIGPRGPLPECEREHDQEGCATDHDDDLR